MKERATVVIALFGLAMFVTQTVGQTQRQEPAVTRSSAAKSILSPPAGTLATGGYLGFLGKNKDFFPATIHLGVDFKRDYGSPVFAVADGEITLVSSAIPGYGGTDKAGGAMIIKHKTGPKDVCPQYCGQTAFALYGHVEKMKPSGHVRMGEQIGVIGHYYQTNGVDTPHLHFGVFRGPRLPDGNKWPWRQYVADMCDNPGWQDPLEFLTTQGPGLYGTEVKGIPADLQLKINRLRDKPEQDWGLLNDVVLALIGNGQVDRAISLVREGLTKPAPAKTPWYSALYYSTLGDALREAGDFENAIAAYEKAESLRPGQSPGGAETATLLKLSLGAIDAAVVHYATLSDDQKREGFASILANTQIQPFGLPTLCRLFRDRPQDRSVRWGLGLAMKDLGKYELAIEHLQVLVSTSTYSPNAYFELAGALERAGRTQAAIAAYQEVTKQAPKTEIGTRAEEAILRLRPQR